MTRTELIELFKTIAPDLESEFTDAQIDSWISLAEPQIGPKVWGDLFDQGLVYLAAHLAAMSSRDGNVGGAIQSEKAGAVSRTYQSTGQDVTEYDQTKYGKRFKALQTQVVSTKPFTTHPSSQWTANGST